MFEQIPVTCFHSVQPQFLSLTDFWQIILPLAKELVIFNPLNFEVGFLIIQCNISSLNCLYHKV